MSTENRPGSDFRRRLGEALLALYLALAPSSVPAWRLAPGPPPGAVLVVGDPVPMLGVKTAGGREGSDGIH